MRYSKLPPLQFRSTPVDAYHRCMEKTNTGDDAVILVSDCVNPRLSQNEVDQLKGNRKAGKMLGAYLNEHHLFLGHYIDKVYLVGSAKRSDVSEAIRNPEVSSVALIGHSGIDSWFTTDGNVYENDIAFWVEEGGHCKNGFGLKDGCNVRTGVHDKHKFQVLAPAYSHHGHDGRMYIVRGDRPDDEIKNIYHPLRGSRSSPGLEAWPELIRLVPRTNGKVL